MKRSLVLMGIAAMLSIGACTNTEKEGSTSAVYACPMDCENGKTYAQKGDCPECGMALKKQKK